MRMSGYFSPFRYIGRTIMLAFVGGGLCGLGISFLNNLSGSAIGYTVLGSALFAGVLGAAIGGANYRTTVMPMKGIMEHINKIAGGEIGKIFDEREAGKLRPIAVSVNQMSVTWQQIITEVREAAQRVNKAAGEMLSSSEQTKQDAERMLRFVQELSEGIDMQVRGAEESNAAVEQIAAGVGRIAENSSGVFSVSLQTLRIAEEGSTSICDSVQQMKTAYESVHRSAGVMKALGDRSQEIGKIVDVITSIAAQTNLLALNAAIEAARAGEHGRGFAVVADEVRKLAEQSAESARQITTLVHEIQADTTLAVQSMDEGLAEVRHGMDVVQQGEKTFGEIVDAARQVARQVQEVSIASEQLSAGSQEISASVEETTRIAKEIMHRTVHVTETFQRQFASFENITKEAESLNRMAEQLRMIIGKVGK
jgi:methyl-accepting chemotaxis protein